MYEAIIYNGADEVARIVTKSAFGAENEALDYIEDLEDAGEDVDSYDYNIKEI